MMHKKTFRMNQAKKAAVLLASGMTALQTGVVLMNSPYPVYAAEATENKPETMTEDALEDILEGSEAVTESVSEAVHAGMGESISEQMTEDENPLISYEYIEEENGDNALHEAIVDLFSSPENVKIVTTNYDQMFEQVLEERAIKVPVYNSPALPLGNDISGIIHIHGNVSDPKYMVVTDEDFGKAYLTEGYASRFLIKLFEPYTVLFVGYSYNDTILRYLTRAMSREHSAKRYILTDDTKSVWYSLGISAIHYPKRSYAVMRNGLIKLGIYAKKALWDWRNQFIEIANNPPKDLTFETQIDYCLENEDRSRVLSSCIHGVGWLDYLDKKDVFSCCFSDSIPAVGTSQDMMEMPVEKLTALLLDYKEDAFEGPTRWGLLNTFSDSVKDNTKWATRLTDHFYKHKNDVGVKRYPTDLH